MSIRLGTIVFDTDDLETESAFWSSVLGGTVSKDGDWHELTVDGAPRLAFQLAPDHVRPKQLRAGRKCVLVARLQ